MAELNFGLLTPPGSQSIGNAFVQGMDQAAAARAQENQNALAQYTLGKAKREDELTNKMLAGMQSATTIEQQAAVLRSVGKVKEANDLLTSDLTQRELRGKLELQPTALASAQVKLVDDKLKQSRSMLEGVTTPEQYIAWHEANHNDPILGKALASRGVTMEQSRARINAALQQPGGLAQLINESKLGVEKFAELNRPQNVQQSMGGSVRTLSIPGMGGNATVVPGSVGTVTPGPGTVPGIDQAATARARAIYEGIDLPGVAPVQPGAPLTPATFPRVTPQVQTQRNNEQIALLNAELQKPENNNPEIQKALRAEIAKLSTGDPFAKAGANPLPVVNNMPGAVAAAGAPGVNAMNVPSPREIREARAKGYAFNPDGSMSRIPGGPADKTVVTRTPVQEVKFRKDLATDYTTTTATTQGMQDVLDSITDVRNSPGLAGATGISGMVYSFPGSQAAAAETNLANLKGKVTSLGQTLANASGKIGPMALQEWTIVRDMVAALDKAVSKGEKITLDEIGKIEFAAKNVAKRVQDKFEGQYGDELSNYPQFATVPEPKSRLSGKIKPAGGGSVTAPKTPTVNIDALLRKYE